MLDQSLNIGPEIQLYVDEETKGPHVKHIRIGSIKLIREIRQLMKDVKYKFSFCIGRGEIEFAGEKVNFDNYEKTYTEAFRLVLVEGLTDEEYEKVDENGIKELDTLLDRFL
jgi:hypothetical protein